MMTRGEILAMLNTSGVAQNLSKLQQALVLTASQAVLGHGLEEPADRRQQARLLLGSVGPAAAATALDWSIQEMRSRGQFQKMQFVGNYQSDLRLIENDHNCPVGEFDNWTNVLRQFLLPRYGALDFDMIVDPRHQIDTECGYPKFITPIMYRYLYDRDDVAARTVDIYPDESWAVDPDVYEDDDEETTTPFEEGWQQLCDTHNLLQYLYRIDKLCGVGHYGVLLLGLDDGKDLEEPVDEPALLAGGKDPIGKPRQLLYLRPFDEYLSFIQQYETDVTSPRYGLPVYYNLIFLDMTIDAAGASIGTRLNRRVHWTRVIHIADNLHSSLVFGVPRMQRPFNRLLDLRKIKGGSGEMFWKGAFPGISFEIDPRFVTDEPDFNEEKFRQEIEDYSNGLQRYLRLLGVSAKSLAPQVSDPEKHVQVQLAAIAAHLGVPLRIFLGSEEARLASSQDKLTWNQRLLRRDRTFTDPGLLRNVINRFIALGLLAPPTKNKRRYVVGWGDRNTSTDEDKANLALKWTQALSQYVASGVVHLIKPMDYLTLILGLRPSDAKRIVDYIESSGGFEKLKQVDPSQGGAVNGVRQNDLSKGETTATTGERPTKRDSGTKQTEGMKG